MVKNSNGDTTIDAVTGHVRVRAANGDIRIERAGAGVDTKTSNGSIRLGELVRGSAVLGTAMPAGLRWFAEYQPFTPIIETLRGLLMDKPIGNNAWIALAWCAAIALSGYLWSKRLFNRES